MLKHPLEVCRDTGGYKEWRIEKLQHHWRLALAEAPDGVAGISGSMT